MGKRYTVEINGDRLNWKDGRFTSDNQQLLARVKSEIEVAKKSHFLTVNLDGSLLYAGKGIDLESSWLGSYALLQEMADRDMRFVSGDRPTWESIGEKLKREDTP